jgi:hypothetical protein
MRVLNERQAAQVLGCSASLLRKWRLAGCGGPDYRKLGRSVKYAEVDLLRFLDSRVVRGDGGHRSQPKRVLAP